MGAHLSNSFAILAISLAGFASSAAMVANAAPTDRGAASRGCVGDGKQDDSDCLQNLLNARTSVGLVRGRTYLIGKSLRVSGAKDFDGNGATLLTEKPLRLVVISGDGANVHNLKLIAAGPQHAYGIVLDTGASNVTVQDNTISGNFVQAILFGGAGQHNLNFIRNRISPMAGFRPAYGILGNPAVLMAAGTPPTGIVIRKNIITNVGSDAIELNSPPPKEMSNIVIEGNTLSAPYHASVKAGFCIGMAGVKNVRISANIMANCKWQGIHVEDHSVGITISGNTINKTIGSEGGQSGSGILLLNSSDIKIYNNQIKNTASSGIELAWNPKGANSNVTIAGNEIVNSGGFGIRVGGQRSTDYGIVVGSPGYGGNRISGSKAGAFMSCLSTIRGSDAQLRTCNKS